MFPALSPDLLQRSPVEEQKVPPEASMLCPTTLTSVNCPMAKVF